MESKVSKNTISSTCFINNNYIEAFAITMILLFITYAFNNIVFFINDDTNILYTLAGFYTGSPADHPFINPILSLFIQGLYNIAPMLPWYPLMHIVCIGFSIYVFVYYVLEVARHQNVPFILTIFVALSIYACYLYTCVVMMQFTTTSAILGSAGVLIALNTQYSEDKKKYRKSILLSCLFLTLSYLFRKNIFPYYAALWLGALFYGIWRENFNDYKLVLPVIFQTALLLIAMIGGAYMSNSIIRGSQEWDNYREFDVARYKMQDYPHDSSSENPELYESLGWTEGLNGLIGEETWSYFMMDPRVDVKAFSAISSTSEKNNNLWRSIKENVISLWNSGIIPKLSFLYIIFTAFLSILIFCKEWRSGIEKNCIVILCFDFLFCMGFIYLAFIQRVPLRALQAINLPIVMCNTIVTISLYRQIKAFFNSTFWTVTIILAVLVSVCDYKCIVEVGYQANERYEKSQNYLIAEEYAINHPEDFFVYDTSLTFRYLPFVSYDQKRPTNIMYWGGMGWKSPAYYEQLKKNGLDELYSNILLQDNAYFITNPNYYIHGEQVFEIFKRYMEETFPGVKTKKITDLDNGLLVYKFEK